MMKLSKPQRKVLAKMEIGKIYSAYDLGVSLATLEALMKKGLIEILPLEPGALFFPRVEIRFTKLKHGGC